MAQTLLANMINPQVMADMVDKKLTDLIRFAPLAVIDTTLVGQPGNTIIVPSWNYIGDAATVNENASVTASVLSTTSASATIKKVAKAVCLTDEAMLSGYGDPVGEATDQIALAIAAAVDNEMLSILHGITGTMAMSTANNSTLPAATDIISAMELFGEDIEDGPTVAVVSPAVYTQMRTVSGANAWVPASEIAAGIALRGVVGEFSGCQVLVSNKLKSTGAGEGDILLVKPGALRIFLKRDTFIEPDRDALYFRTNIVGSKHFAAYLYNAAKVVRIYKPA